MQIEEDLLDHIGSPLTKAERLSLQAERERETKEAQRRAWKSGFKDGSQSARASQEAYVKDLLVKEETAREASLKSLAERLQSTIQG